MHCFTQSDLQCIQGSKYVLIRATWFDDLSSNCAFYVTIKADKEMFCCDSGLGIS